MPEITFEHAREPGGRWKPGGVSPNPGGRPAVLKEVRELARAHTAKAIQRLADMLDDEDGRVDGGPGGGVLGVPRPPA